MYINEQTAQLILDALAWSNQEWVNTLEMDWSQSVATAVARDDFVRFCEARGIEGVERKTKIIVTEIEKEGN